MVFASDPDSWILFSILVTRAAADVCWGRVGSSEGSVLVDIGSQFGLASGSVGVRMVSSGFAGRCRSTGVSYEDKHRVRHKFRPYNTPQSSPWILLDPCGWAVVLFSLWPLLISASRLSMMQPLSWLGKTSRTGQKNKGKAFSHPRPG